MFRSRIDATSPEFARNREEMLGLVAGVRALQERAEAESERARPRFESRGQLLPRERLALLLDPGAPFCELANLAGYRPADPASIAGASQLSGIGFVSGTRCLVHVSDSGINAGAITEAGVAKMLRSQEIALENRLPFVHLVESAGADLLTYEIGWFVRGGKMFANLARLSAAGLPVITVLHGPSTAGGAYMPGLSDVVIAVRGNGKAFLGGPPLLKAATGEIATDADLGGAEMHATVSGLVEHLADDDIHAIAVAREVVGRLAWGRHRLHPPPRDFKEPAHDPDELAGVVPTDYRRAYDVREVVARIVDGSETTDFKAGYGPDTVCLEAEVHGYPVAFVGNNGPIDNQGATKATHFIQRCTQTGTPITFLQNTTGYMVGTAYERGGMIKNGSKMIQAVATAPVPMFTFMIGASFGAGNYGMCGRGFGPRFVMAWPNAQTGLMGAEQAASTMRMVAEGSAARRGQTVDEAGLAASSQRIIEHFDAQSSALVTSGRMLDDGVIDPRDTRKILAFFLATVTEASQLEPRPLTFGVARP